MKFYFCQGCGRRITEKDIAVGEGRDKKLKGVFCSECAVGVTTMESLPVTDEEAKQILDAEGQAAPSASGTRGVRRTSGARIPPAQKGAASSSRMPRSAPATQDSRARFLMPAIVTIAIVVVVGLVVFGFFGPTPLPKPKDQNAHTKREHDPLASNARKTEETPPASEFSGPTKSPTAHAPAGPPNSHEKQSVAPPASAEKDSSAESSGVAKTQAKVTQSPSKETEKKKPEPVAKPPSKELKETKPAKVTRPSGSAQGKPAEVEAAKAKLGAILKAFDQALSKGDLVAASKVAERPQSDPSLKGVAKEAESLVRAGKALSETVAVRQRALEALCDGKERTFQTNKSSLKGVVRKVEGDTLRVRVVGRINRQEIEYEKRVNIADLTPACRAKLLGEQAPATSDGWLARTALKVAERDRDMAEKALSEAGAHPLAPHYRERIAELLQEEREVAARREWEKRVMPLTKFAKFTKTGARTGQKVLSAFRSTHGKTAFAASVALQTKMLERTLAFALGPPPLPSPVALPTIADTSIRGTWAADYNSGTGGYLYTVEESDAGRRILFKFDLTRINRQISNAELSLYATTNHPSQTFTVYRITTDWVEKETTFKARNWGADHALGGGDDTPWAKPGGDYEKTVSATTVHEGHGHVNFDVRQLVQNAIDAGETKVSFVVFAGGKEKVGFCSRETTVYRPEGKRPKLTITHSE